jgi:hypothetical protein
LFASKTTLLWPFAAAVAGKAGDDASESDGQRLPQLTLTARRPARYDSASMPFTISHAAAVLPLRRLGNGRLPLTALMVGSMSPDFSYFLPGDLAVLPTHTFPGLFWFCLPAGLLVWTMYVHLLETPTLSLLPEAWRMRIEPSPRGVTFATLAFACAAIVVGASTHIIWDSFTHRWTPVVQAIPALRVSLLEIGHQRLYVYKLLQHLSTVAGMAILMISAWRIRHAAPVQAPATRAHIYARLAAVSTLLVTSGAFAIANYIDHSSVHFERRLYHLAIGGMSGWMVAWCVIALVMLSSRILRR